MVNDPVKEMIVEAGLKRYHDEEYAKKSILPRFKNIYYPAAESNIITHTFNWIDGLTNEHIKTFSNPLQLAPNQNYCSIRRDTIDERVSTEKVTLTGVWETKIVGPLVGKPWSKEVPIKYSTIGLTFYAFDSKSNFGLPMQYRKTSPKNSKVWQSFADQDFYPMWQTYTKIAKKSRYQIDAVRSAFVADALNLYELKNINWYYADYNYNRNKQRIQPVNYNPVEVKLSSYFGKLEWGEMFFEDPPTSLENENMELYYGIESAQDEARLRVREWVHDQIDILWEYYVDDYDEDDTGWNLEPNWTYKMGQWLLNTWRLENRKPLVGVKSETWLTNFLDAVLGWQFTYLDPWQKEYLLNNSTNLEAFRSSVYLPILLALELPRDDYMDEWIKSILNEG